MMAAKNRENAKRLDPRTLSPEQLARVLAAAGWHQASEETIRADIAAGAPANADGTVNLLHYAAWLVQDLERRERRGGQGG